MKITFNSPVILSFSLLATFVYLLNHPFGLFSEAFILYPVWDFSNFMWYIRLFSNTLGHADGNHLMNNLAFILLLGPIVEEKYGAKNMLIMLFTTAIVASIIHITFSSYMLLGASGIVFMLILISSLVNFKSGEIPLTFILIVAIYIGKEVIGVFQDDNISHMTHIIGGIIGAFFGFMSGGKKTNPKRPIKKSNPMSAIR